MNKELWTAIKFTLFSISAGLIQEAGFLLLYNVLALPYWIAYLMSLVASVVWNFTFNRRYTFRADSDVKKGMLQLLAFYAVFTPLTTWGGHALEGLGVNGNVVQIGTMLLNFVLEYLYQRFVMFRNTMDTNDVARRAEEKKA